MRFSNVIELGYLKQKIIHGEEVKSYDYKKRFANKLSIRSNEFYNSAKLGLRPEICFEVNNHEYQNAVRVRYQDEYYEIVRVFSSNNKETTELYLQKFDTKDTQHEDI